MGLLFLYSLQPKFWGKCSYKIVLIQRKSVYIATVYPAIYCKKQKETRVLGRGHNIHHCKMVTQFSKYQFLHPFVSLLNKNIKCVIGWPKFNTFNMNWKKPPCTSSSLFMICYWNTLASCDSITFLSLSSIYHLLELPSKTLNLRLETHLLPNKSQVIKKPLCYIPS